MGDASARLSSQQSAASENKNDAIWRAKHQIHAQQWNENANGVVAVSSDEGERGANGNANNPSRRNRRPACFRGCLICESANCKINVFFKIFWYFESEVASAYCKNNILKTQYTDKN